MTAEQKLYRAVTRTIYSKFEDADIHDNDYEDVMIAAVQDCVSAAKKYIKDKEADDYEESRRRYIEWMKKDVEENPGRWYMVSTPAFGTESNNIELIPFKK